ncbi:MAG TPA: SPFH domain-containing protein [Anaerolineae bacterium]|nr:SPFH domain-containing protein [Anaerolineae bacterium]
MFTLLTTITVAILTTLATAITLINIPTAILLTTLAAFASYTFHKGQIQVPELEVAVIYNKQNQAFHTFLPAGNHWLFPFKYQQVATIPTTSGSTDDRCTGLQTIGGLPLTISWSTSYQINPFKIPATKQAKAARTLPSKTNLAIQKHLNNCLQHIIGEYTIEQLCEPGIHKRLEREARLLLGERLASLGIQINRVMIGAIEMPPKVQATLAATHERHMQIVNEAQALARLQAVISQFSDDDMQRLMELERIHMLGQNGVALPYPTAFDSQQNNPNRRRPTPAISGD